MQWEDIRYFLALARHGSLSAAARALQVEHSTVSRRVVALEETIQLQLFDRQPRGWQLTVEGHALLPYAERVEQEMLSFSRATLSTTAVGGAVRLSAPSLLLNTFLIPQLASQRARWPLIELHVSDEIRSADPLHREADLAIRLGRPQDAALATRRLAILGYGLYAAPGYAQKPPEDWRFIGADHHLRHAPEQQWLETFSNGRRFAFRCNRSSGMLEAAVAGLGVAVLPHCMARAAGTLVTVEGSFDIPLREIWLLVHPDARRIPRVQVFVDLLTDLFQHHARLLEEGVPPPDLFSEKFGETF
ncbi:MAG: LysR family transcriptional regulator [Burkholderiales bacterium]|jgi:DNA-binding transcriptional LysR family regulator|nr:LysR family transcriptional regulator [Burkholderiales bacterium]